MPTAVETSPVTDAKRVFDGLLEAMKEVARSGGRITESGADLAARELAMAVGISEKLRDLIFSEESLREARAQPLNRQLRDEGHRLVDVIADTGGVAIQAVVDAFGSLTAGLPARGAAPAHTS